MKITYDKSADALYICFKESAAIKKTVELHEGLMADFDKQGRLAGLEVLLATKQISAAQIKKAIRTGVPVFV